MKGLLVLAVVVACVAADRNCCSNEDRHRLQEMWESIWGSRDAGRRLDIATSIFERLFEINPDAKTVFERVNVADMASPEFQAHMMRIVGAMDTIIEMAMDTDTLNEELDHLAQQHSVRTGLKKEYFDDMRHAMVDVMSQAIPCFNRDAWSRCFRGMADRIAAGVTA